jgi:hypothetical protein
MEGQGSPSPKPPPKKKRAKSQAPKDKAKRRDRLLDDQDVQELLQEEREADSRAMFDVDKAFDTVALMEQCVRDSHKLARASQDTADRRAEQVEKLELLNKDNTEQMHYAVACIAGQEILIERQAEERTDGISWQEAHRAVRRTATQRNGSCNRRIVGRRKDGSSIA